MRNDSSEEVKKEKRRSGTGHTGRLEQTGIYIGKFLRIFIYQKDWKVLPMAALIGVIVSYVVGRSLFQTQEGTLLGALAIACVCIWDGFFNSIQVVCRERAIIKREHRSGLHISSYIAAQMIYQAFLCTGQCVILIVVLKLMNVHFVSGAAVTGVFAVDLFITMFLITYAADMMALMVSCIVKDTTSAMTVMPMLLIVELVFSGVAFPLSGRAGKIANITISKWGIYALCTTSNYNGMQSSAVWTAMNKLGEVPVVKQMIETIRDTPGMRYDLQMWTGAQMQKAEYAFSRSHVLEEWGLLLLFALAYALIGMIFLEFIDKDKR